MQDLEMNVWDTRRLGQHASNVLLSLVSGLTEVVFTEPWLLLALFSSMPRIWLQPWCQQGSIFTRRKKILHAHSSSHVKM